MLRYRQCRECSLHCQEICFSCAIYSENRAFLSELVCNRLDLKKPRCSRGSRAAPKSALHLALSSRKPLINRTTPIALAMERRMPKKSAMRAESNFGKVQTNSSKVQTNSSKVQTGF